MHNPCFLYKIKAIIKRALSIKRTVLVTLKRTVTKRTVHVTLAKPNVMQGLDGMNMIIQLKVQNHGNTFKAASITVLHRLLF